MENKIGVYICRGCDIAKSIDVEKLTEVATDEMKAPLCKAHDVLCSRDGIDMITADIAKEELNRVVIGACSPRAFPELFEFDGDVLTERLNLREQVAWSHAPNDEDTQMLADDYVRMSITRADATDPPDPLVEETSKDVLVIGGGMTGMTAAREAAAAGYKVTLIEKEEKLGGWASKFSKVFPKHPPYRELEDSGCARLIEEIEAN